MLPPGLSMLWESIDPRTALHHRFGHAEFDSAAAWLADVLAERWGISGARCSRLVLSDHNAVAWVRGGGQPLIVKWSAASVRFAALADSADVLSALATRGIPVAAPVRATDGAVRALVGSPVGEVSILVQPEVAGGWLDVRDDAAVRSAGESLARLHDALGAIRPRSEPAADPRAEMARWLASDDHGRAPIASAALAAALRDAPSLDDAPQLVHGDYRAANILVDGSGVVGILDFDEMTTAHRVHDLARSSVYLGTLFTDWRPTSPRARRLLRAGYETVRPLAAAEAAWLDLLTRWMAIRAIPGSHAPAIWAAAADADATP